MCVVKLMPISSISLLLLLLGGSIFKTVRDGSVMELCDKGLSLKSQQLFFSYDCLVSVKKENEGLDQQPSILSLSFETVEDVVRV